MDLYKIIGGALVALAVISVASGWLAQVVKYGVNSGMEDVLKELKAINEQLRRLEPR